MDDHAEDVKGLRGLGKNLENAIPGRESRLDLSPLGTPPSLLQPDATTLKEVLKVMYLTQAAIS
jgi:hypothetical protein